MMGTTANPPVSMHGFLKDPQGICSLEIHVPFSGDSAEYFWARPQLLSVGSRESNPAMKRINTNIFYIYIYM